MGGTQYPVVVPLLSSLEDHIPLFRRLWLQWDGLESQAEVDSVDCFRSAVSLVDIGVHSRYRFVPTLLPMHNQITQYFFDAPWETHSELLKLVPNLIEACIVISFDDGPWSVSHATNTVDLLCLRRLLVSDVETLDYLRTPALEEMSLYVREEDNPHLLLHLEPFLERSSCVLRSLYLKWNPSVRSIAEILRTFPSITRLAIAFEGEEDTVADTFFAHFTHTGRAVAVRGLREIHVGFSRACRIDYPRYLKMLRSWWKSKDCALQAAALLMTTDSDSGPDLATLGGLDTLRKDGLDVLLLSGSKAQKIMNRWVYTSSSSRF
ncbi:hypothetical protein DFH07DRAFT_462787 [Mycena maculata]|uniref:Uncharacterized protein n=1 Tax=Mycena maculata TaxID=230809 RepID=A0AAD7NYF6_9AGAR|nr:hypothetical protein DFH07DRAFT_462787 [Mycena maculata]